MNNSYLIQKTRLVLFGGFTGLLLAVLLFALSGCEGSDDNSGALVVDETYTVGSFQISVNQAKTTPAAITVSHTSNADRVLFETSKEVPFVAAGKGNVVVTELRGCFTIEDPVDIMCESPVLTSAAVEGGALHLKGRFDDDACEFGFEMVFSSSREKRLSFDLKLDAGTDFNQLFLRYTSDKDERFYGFGTQFTHLDVKGRTFPVITQDQGIGRGLEGVTRAFEIFGSAGDWYTSYAVTPQYITNTGKSLFLENREVAFFNFEDPESVEIKLLLGTQMKGNILAGTTPMDFITEFTEYTGRMGPLPDWINEGAIVGMQGGDAKALEKLAALEAENTPIAAFWLQDWVGTRKTGFGSQLWWNWELNRNTYPGWDEMMATFKSKDIRVMVYISPKLANTTGEDSYNPTRNLYQEAAEKNYLVRNKDGEPYPLLNTDFAASLVDFTNPEAWDWYKKVIKDQLLAVGASGWMADFGEALPFDAVLASGIDAAVYHNQYVEDWARLNREVLQDEDLEGEVVFFMRAGYTASPGYSTLFWLGDQLVSWDTYDGLKSAVKGMLSGGLSGFSLNHSDIGGYTTVTGNPSTTTVRSKELLMRWMEKSAFTATYRTHEGNRPEANVQFYSDQETYSHFAKFAKVYAALAPYRKTLIAEAATVGAPVARHPIIEYPADPVAWNLEYQWMLGSDFMVAPVVDEGATSVNVYLPAGEWVHLWSGETRGSQDEGQWVTIDDAVMGQPPVFYKKDSAAAAAFVAKLQEYGVME